MTCTNAQFIVQIPSWGHSNIKLTGVVCLNVSEYHLSDFLLILLQKILQL